MFNSISWMQYFTTIIILLIIFYAIVGYRFFKWEILGFIGIKKVEMDQPHMLASLSNFEGISKEDNFKQPLLETSLNIDISPMIDSFNDEVTAYIKSAKKGDISKIDIIRTLQAIIAKYPTIKNSALKPDLDADILKEINLQYPGMFQQNDLKNLWN